MTIATKGARAIVVGGVEYRWAVRKKPTYSQGLGHNDLTLAIDCGSSGQTLRVTVPGLRSDNWMSLPGLTVTPGDISRWIPLALAAGWQPTKPGSTFEMTIPAEDPALQRGAG